MLIKDTDPVSESSSITLCLLLTFFGSIENNPPKRKSLSTQIPAFFSPICFLELRVALIFLFSSLNYSLVNSEDGWLCRSLSQTGRTDVPMSLTVEINSGFRKSAIPVGITYAAQLSSIIFKLSQSSFAWCCVNRNRKLQFRHAFLRIFWTPRTIASELVLHVERILLNHIWLKSATMVTTSLYNLINRHFFLHTGIVNATNLFLQFSSAVLWLFQFFVSAVF